MEHERGDRSGAAQPVVSGLRASLAALVLAALALALILFHVHQREKDVARTQIGQAIAAADGVRVAVAI